MKKKRDEKERRRKERTSRTKERTKKKGEESLPLHSPGFREGAPLSSNHVLPKFYVYLIAQQQFYLHTICISGTDTHAEEMRSRVVALGRGRAGVGGLIFMALFSRRAITPRAAKGASRWQEEGFMQLWTVSWGVCMVF